jgi:hypothetical protein
MPGNYDRFETANVICITLGIASENPGPAFLGTGPGHFSRSQQSVAAAPTCEQQIGQMAV